MYVYYRYYVYKKLSHLVKASSKYGLCFPLERKAFIVRSHNMEYRLQCLELIVERTNQTSPPEKKNEPSSSAVKYVNTK